MINYYRIFIKGYAGKADKASPLNKLTESHINGKQNNKYIQWSNEAEEAFFKLKKVSEQATHFLILKTFFYLTTDASDIAIGDVLQQKGESDHIRLLTFFCRKLNKTYKL